MWPLFIAHGLSTWGNRMWEFAVAVITLDLFADSPSGASLLPVALYGVAENVAVIAFGSTVGRKIDTCNRLRLQQGLLTVEDISLSIAAVLLLVGYEIRHDVHLLYLVFAAVLLLGSLGNLAATMSTVAMEKDWVVALASEFDEPDQALCRLNSTMRRIDLCCKIAAPIVVGVIATTSGTAFTLVFLALFNALTWPLELILASRLYHSSPALALSKQPANPTNAQPQDEVSIMQSIKEYLRHDVVLASISYALLYGSLLGTGSLATAYLLWRGLSEVTLATARGMAAIAGLGATVTMPRFVSGGNLTGTAMWFLVLQLGCLLPALLSLMLPMDQHLALALLLGCLISSRFGLWGFDLCSVQIMQVYVRPEESGRINGVQSSFISCMYLGSYALGILFPRPQDFVIPSFISVGLVVLSVILFTIFHVRSGSLLPHGIRASRNLPDCEQLLLQPTTQTSPQ